MDINITVVVLWLVFVTLETSQSAETKVKNHETLLLNTIFKDYDKRIRPVANYHTPVLVGFGIELHQIIQVDEKHQVITTNIFHSVTWKDEFLRWMPENYGNITHISIRRDSIWTPDIQLYNSASFDEGGVDSYSNTKIFVGSDGSVVDVMPMVMKSTCKIDVTWFPFDEQKCFLEFGSWTSSSKYLLLQLSEGVHDNLSTVDNGEWSLLGVTSSSSSATYSCCPDESYLRIIYAIHLKRRPFYYFFSLLVPCGLIGFLAILGFTLPPESGEKLPLGATLLFSLIVFLNMISETMPANSDTVPLLGTYFNCVMFTIALSVVSTIVVNVNVRSSNPRKVDGFSRKLFFRWLPRILRMDISTKIFAEQDAVFTEKRSEDLMKLQINRARCLETAVTYDSLHAKILAQQWSFIASVVDRVCLMSSLVITFVSVTIFLIYAY